MEDNAHLPKIRIFRYDRESILPCITPNNGVRRSFQSHMTDMDTVGIDIRQTWHKLRREVLVEEKFHFAITVR